MGKEKHVLEIPLAKKPIRRDQVLLLSYLTGMASRYEDKETKRTVEDTIEEITGGVEVHRVNLDIIPYDHPLKPIIK